MKRGILAVVLSLNLIIMTGLPVLAEENETSHNVEMCYQSPNNARSIFLLENQSMRHLRLEREQQQLQSM